MSKTDIFKQVLAEESDYPLTETLYNYILENTDTLTFQKNEPIVEAGTVNPDIYIIRSGIVRGYLLNDGNETNLYFGMEGTFLSSMQSYAQEAPSIMTIEACCPTTVLRIRKPRFQQMLTENNEFCRWVVGVFTLRASYDELKSKIMNGDAKWRYEWLERCRPELFDNVPLKAIASYLKMTEVHVSRIRNQIIKGRR